MSKDEQHIVNLLSNGNTMLEIAKKFNKNYRTNKKEIECFDRLKKT